MLVRRTKSTASDGSVVGRLPIEVARPTGSGTSRSSTMRSCLPPLSSWLWNSHALHPYANLRAWPTRTRSPRPAAEVAFAVVWVTLPFTAGPALADTLDPRSSSFRTVASLGLWVVWAVTLVMALVPRTVTLTAIRIVAPAAVVAVLWGRRRHALGGTGRPDRHRRHHAGRLGRVPADHRRRVRQRLVLRRRAPPPTAGPVRPAPRPDRAGLGGGGGGRGGPDRCCWPRTSGSSAPSPCSSAGRSPGGPHAPCTRWPTVAGVHPGPAWCCTTSSWCSRPCSSSVDRSHRSRWP